MPTQDKIARWFALARRGPVGTRVWLRYHGMWAPGVRLMQNLRFRDKALLLVICLILPMGYQVGHDWQRNRQLSDVSSRAVAGMALYQKVAAEMASLGALGTVMYVAEPASPARIGAAKAEQASFLALREAVSADRELSREVREQMIAAERARTEALRLVDDSRPGVQGGSPPRFTALTHAERQVDELRDSLLRELGTGLHGDPQMLSLVDGGLSTLPRIVREIRQATRIGDRVYREAAKPRQGLRLMERVRAVEVLLDQAERDLQPALAQELIDPHGSREALAQLRRFVNQARQVAQVSLDSTSDQEVVAASGATPEAYRRTGLAAERAGSDLHAAALAATLAGLKQRADRGQSEAAISLWATGLGLFAMAYLLVCFIKVMGGGLHELNARVAALAQGDLSEKAPARGSDEIGVAMTALAASIRRMATLFEAVTQGVAAVSHASREVAVGNAGLSGRTGEMRRSIGDVGERARSFMDAMNRCGEEVERIAEHMRDVRAGARRSRKAMTELQDRMNMLQQKSREIGRVVLLVEAVAHQTRLLSLNASVEAARAGLAGKGFAVVAQEVRDLASRSRAAAQKISDIVQSSVVDIEAGGVLTDRVADAVRNTDERVADVSAIMSDIVQLTRSGRDQSQEVVGITRSVEESAGGNARMVEQLAHASADLRVQGDNLKRSMQHFVFG